LGKPGGRTGSRVSLPEPSAGDVFLDLEADPFVETTGLEYLLGYVTIDSNRPEYQSIWSFDPLAERKAFETFVDLIMARWKQFPDLHIYHFSPYEPGAMKRLMGRYASWEDQIDRMLRAGLFVDLHLVVRQGLRASVETYSSKDLEAFHEFKRATALEDARTIRTTKEFRRHALREAGL
jgi:predicted RecB family nuclease